MVPEVLVRDFKENHKIPPPPPLVNTLRVQPGSTIMRSSTIRVGLTQHRYPTPPHTPPQLMYCRGCL